MLVLAVGTGCGMVDLGRLVGVSLIRFRITVASPIILTSSPKSRSAGRLGVFRGVEGVLGRGARNTSSSSTVRSTRKRLSDVFGTRVVCPEGRNPERGGGGGGEMMLSLLPVPETQLAVE